MFLQMTRETLAIGFIVFIVGLPLSSVRVSAVELSTSSLFLFFNLLDKHVHNEESVINYFLHRIV